MSRLTVDQQNVSVRLSGVAGLRLLIGCSWLPPFAWLAWRSWLCALSRLPWRTLLALGLGEGRIDITVDVTGFVIVMTRVVRIVRVVHVVHFSEPLLMRMGS